MTKEDLLRRFLALVHGEASAREVAEWVIENVPANDPDEHYIAAEPRLFVLPGGLATQAGAEDRRLGTVRREVSR